MDVDAIAVALAARYAPAQVTPPAGYQNVRTATGDLPHTLSQMPVVLVWADSGALDTGGGTRSGLHRYLVQFYYGLARNLARENKACRLWLTVLLDQLKTGGAVKLGGLAENVEVADWRIGILSYAGKRYSGIELGVNVTTSEGWLPT
ncbi:MAG TPA: hypothetical protein VGQ02_10865 [Candidatus Limnocylindrales bacterium]|jgi:hypothetical protein|nr:hypothetical protein [Candidatus Limnocylindrales bacterium]